jgi:hypothetical protein
MVDYTTYKAEDFLRDDYFIHSMQHPTPESRAFWKEMTEKGNISSEEFNFAEFFISSLTPEKNRMSELELNRLFKRIESDTTKRLQKRKKIFYYSAAASIALMMSVSLWLFYPRNEEDAILHAGLQYPETNSEYVELIFSDKERIAIKEDEASIDYGQKGTIKINEKIIEKQSDNTAKTNGEKEETAFNRLAVPYGKRSSLILEDGTHVWVNAGTSVVYPASFDDDRREIYVDGEICLNVVKDEKRPFLVKTSDLQIEVLGTSFNVTAYKSDESSAVVLVNGSVKVKTQKKSKPYILKPDDMFTCQDNNINIKQVDASSCISWIHGIYIFDNENIRNIALRLSRYYNIKISVDEQSAGLLCSGKLHLKDDIIDVLNVLQSTAPVHYETDEKGEYKIKFNP